MRWTSFNLPMVLSVACISIAALSFLTHVPDLVGAVLTPSLGDDPTARLVDLCRVLGADEYLSGADGASYMDLGQFEAAGIGVIFQQYDPPTYPQLFGEFKPHLSALDLALNCGPDSLPILRQGRGAGPKPGAKE